MSIRIDTEKCVGCGRCVDICPGTLIGFRGRKAHMNYPKDCWGCVSCVKECAAGAIEFFLGADIGGNGGTMRVVEDGSILHWQLRRGDGTVKVIDVDRQDANKY